MASPPQHLAAPVFRAVAVDEHRERVRRLGIDQQRHLDEIALAIAAGVEALLG